MAVPYVFPRRVGWADCDPAGMIYTPRVIDIATEALECWNRDVLGVSWFDLNWKLNLGAPMVRVECDFLKIMPCDLELLVEVRVLGLGRASVTFQMTGQDSNGDKYFRTTYVVCYIDRKDHKSTPVPERFRGAILAYQAACDAAA